MISRLIAPLSVAVLLLVVSACNDDGGPSPTETAANASAETPEATAAGQSEPSESPEQMLAAVHAGEAVDESDPSVDQFRSILDTLEEKCPDERQEIADIGVDTHDSATERGIEITLLQMMQDLTDNIPPDLANIGLSCAVAFAAYVETEAPR